MFPIPNPKSPQEENITIDLPFYFAELWLLVDIDENNYKKLYSS